MPGGIHPPQELLAQWVLRHNYEDPFQRSGLIPIIVIFTIFSILMVSARMYVRGYMQRNLGLDDWVLIAAMFPTIGLSVAICLGVGSPYYFGRHVWDVPIPNFVAQRKLSFAIEILYIVSSALIKVSILLFFRRLSTATFSKPYVYTIWACIGFVIAWCITYIFVLCFECDPINAFWDQLSLEWAFGAVKYHCINEGEHYISACIMSVIQDFMAALLPSWLFFKLHIPKRQKIALACVFLIGFVTCIVGIIRAYYVHVIFYQSYDVPYYAWTTWLTTGLEVLLGTMCASAPPLKMFFKRMLEIRQNTTSRSKTGGNRLESLTEDLAGKRDGWMASKSQSTSPSSYAMPRFDRNDAAHYSNAPPDTAPWVQDMHKSAWYSDEERGSSDAIAKPHY